jgi:hypothetical protein
LRGSSSECRPRPCDEVRADVAAPFEDAALRRANIEISEPPNVRDQSRASTCVMQTRRWTSGKSGGVADWSGTSRSRRRQQAGADDESSCDGAAAGATASALRLPRAARRCARSERTDTFIRCSR